MLLRVLICALSLAFAAGAAAQAYRWVDKDGKVRYGDTPPPGVNATPLKGSSRAAGAPAADAKKGEKDKLSPEAAFRKRQEIGRASCRERV